MAKIHWSDALTQNALVAGVVGLLLWFRRRRDPAATTPGQRLSDEGIVICTNCDHLALFHLGRGCICCGCMRDGRSFVYPRPKKVTYDTRL